MTITYKPATSCFYHDLINNEYEYYIYYDMTTDNTKDTTYSIKYFISSSLSITNTTPNPQPVSTKFTSMTLTVNGNPVAINNDNTYTITKGSGTDLSAFLRIHTKNIPKNIEIMNENNAGISIQLNNIQNINTYIDTVNPVLKNIPPINFFTKLPFMIFNRLENNLNADIFIRSANQPVDINEINYTNSLKKLTVSSFELNDSLKMLNNIVVNVGTGILFNRTYVVVNLLYTTDNIYLSTDVKFNHSIQILYDSANNAISPVNLHYPQLFMENTDKIKYNNFYGIVLQKYWSSSDYKTKIFLRYIPFFLNMNLSDFNLINTEIEKIKKLFDENMNTKGKFMESILTVLINNITFKCPIVSPPNVQPSTAIAKNLRYNGGATSGFTQFASNYTASELIPEELTNAPFDMPPTNTPSTDMPPTNTPSTNMPPTVKPPQPQPCYSNIPINHRLRTIVSYNTNCGVVNFINEIERNDTCFIDTSQPYVNTCKVEPSKCTQPKNVMLGANN